jgi:hypothetical protein
VKRNIARLAGVRREAQHRAPPAHENAQVPPHGANAARRRCEGLTVAKAGEAATMGEVCRDLFVAYPALDPWRREHLAQLARRTRSASASIRTTRRI